MIDTIRRVKIAHGTYYAVAVGVAVPTVILAAASHVYIYSHLHAFSSRAADRKRPSYGSETQQPEKDRCKHIALKGLLRCYVRMTTSMTIFLTISSTITLTITILFL